MRLLPILTAIIVAAFLYGIVFEREALQSALRGTPEAEAPGDPAQSAAPAAEAVPEETAIKVVVLESEARPIDNAVVLRGRTEADRQVSLRAETSGLVISEPRRKGSFVAQGDVICELDPGTRPAALAEAEAALAEAVISNTAAARLAEGGFASETRAVAALAILEAATAAVARAEKEIERLTVTAPFDGLLETDSAELGSLLQAGAECATLLQLDPIRLVGFLPETSVDAVELGARAGARLASGAMIEGNVTFVSRSADPQTRTFRVDIEVPNPNRTIRDGQTAEILIEAQGAQAHLIPPSALTLDDGGTMGLRLVDDQSRARFTPVTLLRDSLEGMFVTGLPDQATIIVAGQEYVSDGVLVAPHPAEGGL